MFHSGTMGLMSVLPPSAARRLVTAVFGLCLAGSAGVAVSSPAVAAAGVTASGVTVEHWGRYSGNRNLSPVAITLPAPVAQIGTANSAEYALLTNGTVYAWGDGGDGQLGDGGTANSFTTPVQVQFPAGVTIASIATDVSPYNTALAVDTTGHAWGWGFNRGGELCLGNTKEYLTPVELPFSQVTTLAGAADHASYDAGGTVYSCGGNKFGDLGDGTTTSSTTPVKVTGLDDALVTTLVAAWGNTGALLSDGDYYDWGYNSGGQVGNGTTTNAKVPYQVPLPAAVTVAAQGGSLAGNGQTIVLLAGGALYAWGNGEFYQLGNGVQGNQTSPIRITPPRNAGYTALASGGSTCYGVTKAGAVWAWGNGASGQVGDGTTKTAKHPVKVETGATAISATADNVAVSTAP
jgi:alpha-tubulin suppressor-like RCC1 family protein